VNHTGAASSESRAATVGIWSALSVVYVIWGSTYLAIRFTVETTPPFLSAAARFIISGAFLYLWRRAAGDPAPTPRQSRNAAIIGIFLLVGGNGGVVWAAQFIPSSLSALLVATVPLWMILINALRPDSDQPSLREMSGILIGFCGAVLLIGWTTNTQLRRISMARSLSWRRLSFGQSVRSSEKLRVYQPPRSSQQESRCSPAGPCRLR
jgi:drug/metabolite transporter (DMT)-like permease